MAMEVWSIIQALLALVFVLGLMLVTLWLMKYLQLKSNNSRLFKHLQSDERIRIVEKKRLDAKNMLILLKKDDKEFFVLTGAGGSLLLDSALATDGKIIGEAGKND